MLKYKHALDVLYLTFFLQTISHAPFIEVLVLLLPLYRSCTQQPRFAVDMPTSLLYRVLMTYFLYIIYQINYIAT